MRSRRLGEEDKEEIFQEHRLVEESMKIKLAEEKAHTAKGAIRDLEMGSLPNRNLRRRKSRMNSVRKGFGSKEK